MKHSLRNALIAACHYSGAAKRHRTRVHRQGPLVRVLCFHDVPNQEWFEAVIRRIHNECRVVSPTEWKQSQFDANRVNVLLTFDDGYHSWLEVVAPTLEGHSLSGLFFISDGVFAAAGDTEAETKFCKEQLRIKHRALLPESGARSLVESGHTIGGHTSSHVSMSSLSKDDIQQELVSNKTTLEALAGETLHDFAYPFGTPRDINRETRSAARTAGYTYTYSAVPGFVTHDSDDIPRLLIDETQSPHDVMRWINGAYDVYYRYRSKLL